MDGDVGRLAFYRLPSGEEYSIFLPDFLYPNHESTNTTNQELALNKEELHDLLELAKVKDPHVELSDILFTVVRDGVSVEFTVGRDDTDAIPLGFRLPTIKNFKKPDSTINLLDPKAGEDDILHSFLMSPTTFELKDPDVELSDIVFAVDRDDVSVDYTVGRVDAIPAGFRVPTMKKLKKPDPNMILDPDGEIKMPPPCDPMNPTRFEKRKSSSLHPRCVMCLVPREFIELVENRNGKGSGCGHLYCPDCLRSYLAKEMNEHLTQVMCPEKNCDQLVMIWDLCGMIGVPKEVKDRWKSAVQEAAILMNPKEIVCPLCSAKFQDDGRDPLIRACPHCWKLFCTNCRIPYHLGKSCEEACLSYFGFNIVD